jgi:hypothetical protein
LVSSAQIFAHIIGCVSHFSIEKTCSVSVWFHPGTANCSFYAGQINPRGNASCAASHIHDFHRTLMLGVTVTAFVRRVERRNKLSVVHDTQVVSLADVSNVQAILEPLLLGCKALVVKKLFGSLAQISKYYLRVTKRLRHSAHLE